MSRRRAIVTMTPDADPAAVARAVTAAGWAMEIDLSAAGILVVSSDRPLDELVRLEGVAAVEPDRQASASG